MSDLVLADADIDWSVHMPQMMHMATLELDAARSIIHDHCMQIIVHMLIVHSRQHDQRLITGLRLLASLDANARRLALVGHLFVMRECQL